MPQAMCCYQTSMLLLTSEMDLKENNSTTERKDRGVKKQPGCTWIEVNNEMYTFIVDDQDHPQVTDACRTKEIVWLNDQCRVHARYPICTA
jgi:hypothetical protein